MFSHAKIKTAILFTFETLFYYFIVTV